MRKGIFIPDITVEMFRNASLEVVEELLVSGSMEDIEIPERPHGEWKDMREDDLKISDYQCSCCSYWSDCDYNFCQNCGAKMGGE